MRVKFNRRVHREHLSIRLNVLARLIGSLSLQGRLSGLGGGGIAKYVIFMLYGEGGNPYG